MTKPFETSAYDLHKGDAPNAVMFLCDHGSNKVPGELGTLGLQGSAFEAHIAYDIGAAGLTRALADAFAAPAFLARWSRLVVDLNRGADDPTVVMKLSDGRIIPGNRDLDGAGIADRIARYHAPYHEAIAARIAEARAKGIVPILISMHSFTPVWRGKPRPWHVGVLWDKDSRLAKPLLERLQREGDIVAGDNEPYTGALENDCLYRHGTMNGLPHVLVEVRQDLIAEPQGVARWAVRLERILRDAIEAMGPATVQFTSVVGSKFA